MRSISGGPPAVDTECLPGDECGALEVQDPINDVGDLPDAAERVQPSEFRVLVWAVHRRLDHAERDRVDPHVVGCVLNRERTRDGFQPALGQRGECRGRVASRVVDEAGRDVDHVSGALALHLSDRALGDVEEPIAHWVMWKNPVRLTAIIAA